MISIRTRHQSYVDHMYARQKNHNLSPIDFSTNVR